MTALEHLTIKNFRGFDSLEIDGFSKINLFVGKNNSGKTSVLESIFLVIGMSNPVLPSTINQIRGINTMLPKQLGFLFHKLNLENKPAFFAKFNDGSERNLKLDVIVKQNESLKNSSSVSAPETVGVGLRFSEKAKDEQEVPHESFVTFEGTLLNQLTPKDYKEKFHAVIVAEKDDIATLARFSEMIKRKEDAFVLKVLQKFDDNIRDIKALPDGIYFDVKNIDELVLSNIMGDGIRRFLNIVTAVSEKKGSFVCIDEIENGLHYTAYKLLWESLLSFSEVNNVQLFISTHNIETLSCLKSVLEEDKFSSMQEYAKVFTISKTANSGYKAYRYSFEGFKDAIDHETEIRN